MTRVWNRARFGCLGLLVLASCFHGPTVKPTALLAPSGADSAPLRSQGPFAVVYAAPKGHVIDRKQPGVTVLFSRGVRSVETADDAQVPAISLTTKTGGNVAGAWRWTGTRGLLFSPDGELPGGTDYVVSVPQDVRALDGSTLARPYTFELATDGPRLMSFRVIGPPGTTERSLPASPNFRIQFDQSVDPAAVAAATTLRVFKADGDPGTTMKVTGMRESTPARPSAPPPVKKGGKPAPTPPPAAPPVPAEWVVMLLPEKPLPLDSQVDLAVSESLRGTGGPRPMGTAITRPLRTHGPLRFVDFYCPRIEAKGRCRANGDVKVTLSNPVAPDELKAHVKLGKLPPRPPGKEARKIEPALEQWLGVAPKVGEQYRVVLTAGMKDIYGQTLAKDASFDLAVESALVAPAVAAVAPPVKPPPVKPPLPGSSADARPRRERLPYQLDLGLSGQILEASGAHKVPVGAVNIPTYSTVSASLSDAQATAWTLNRGNTADFVSRNGFASTWVTTHADTNERAVDFIDLDATLASKKGKGPALVILAPPGLTGDYGRTESLVSVTDLGVTAKLSPFGSLVWVTQLSSGKPVQNAQVAIRTTKGGEVFSGTTDASGLVVVPIDRFDPVAKPEASGGGDEENSDNVRNDAAILVHAGDDFTITKVAHSPVERRLTSEFQDLTKLGQWVGMLFADRGVFRPGETAKVSGIVRVAEASGLRSIAGRELRIQLTDHNSEQIFDGRAKCDDFGTFALDLPIPKTAELGPATITATAMAGGASNTSESGVFRHEIRLLAYKPNEFKVVAESDKPWYVRGDTATFATQGDYLYGAPMQGASVTTTVSRQEVPFEPPNSAGYTTTDDQFTGDVSEESKAASEVDNQDGTLDARGHFDRKVDLSFADQRRPERVVFDADVQDLSRASVSARASAIVHPGEFYVGIKTPKERFVGAGTPLKTDIAAFDPKGDKRANVKVKVELVERKWSAVAGEQPDGKPTHSSKPQDVIVTSCEATTSAAIPAGCDLRVPRAGYFIVRATATDPRGNVVRSSTSIYGTEQSATAAPAWAADDRHGIKLEPNKKSYDIGETAKVLLRSPFREGEALVTIERNGVLWRSVVPIKGPVPVVEVPVKPEMYPNAYVAVVALRGRVQAAPASGADLGGPDFRYGWSELHVNEDAHRLEVNVTRPKDEYQPGTTVEADVVVKDRSGQPAESALTFYVVDEGVLALTSYQTPDPLPAFVRRRKLGVLTFDNREGLGRILPMKAGEKLAPRGYEYALARNPGDSYDKGDDGGDGGQKRADFRTTAYFEAGRKTDKNGHAHFSFKLPDNLTTFRIMAVAAGADDRFGSGESKVTTYRRLMARPALPRFIRAGDQLEASVIVSSKADQPGPMSVAVKMDAKGLVASGPTSKTVTMQRGGQMEVRFPVRAIAPGEATLTFDVRSGSDTDKVEMKRKIDLPTTIESKVVYGETGDETAIGLGKLEGIRKDFGGLDVRVASSALVGLGLTIDRIGEYPYDCTEQLTSRIMPLVAAHDLTRDAGAKLPADTNPMIDSAIEAIVKRQNGDGGFGFWDHSASEPWLSAYSMLAIQGALERKRFVPKDVVERGKEYLSLNLASATRKLAKDPAAAKDAGADDVEKEEVARRSAFVSGALVADTLATLGTPNPGAINVLYDARSGERLFGQAALLHAMAKSEMSAVQIAAFAKEIEGHVRVGPNLADIEEQDDERLSPILESHARTLAMVLRAFLAVDPKSRIAPRLARQLLALRRDGAWRTTQEDTWSILALADYRRLQEASFGAIDVHTYLGGKELLTSKFLRGSFHEEEVRVSSEALASRGPTLAFAVDGDGRAYFAAELKYATTSLPARPLDEGLFVTKYVRGLPPAEVAKALPSIPRRTADAVTAGDLVIVDLLFESAEPRDQIVVDDPLAAGLEALDYDLDTTSKAGRDAETKSASSEQAHWLGTTFRTAESHREVRDDRVLTFFDHVEPGMYRVQYLAHATSIGTFVVPPTRIEAMYEPEIFGRTAASKLSVTAKQ